MSEKAKFKVAMKKDGNSIVKIAVNSDDTDGTWFTTTDAVVNFAKKVFKENDEVEVTYKEEEGIKSVVRIEKIGGSSSYKKPSEFTPKKSAYTGGTKSDNFRTPEQITNDEIGHMTAKTLVSLQGHVDPNNVSDLIKEIYATYRKLIKGE